MADPVTPIAAVFRGRAAVEGVVGVYDAILYAINQTLKATQNFEEEIIKDQHGYDTAWLFRNEHAMFDCTLKLVGDTAAHAAIPATTVSTTSVISSLGQPFLSPGNTIVLSTFTLTALNGTYQIISGWDADMGNTKVADLAIKLRKYANSQQNGTAEGGYGYIPT